jgi:hypothetical protein
MLELGKTCAMVLVLQNRQACKQYELLTLLV